MAFDNARTLIYYKLRTFILLSKSACLKKTSRLFQQLLSRLIVHINFFLKLENFLAHCFLSSKNSGGAQAPLPLPLLRPGKGREGMMDFWHQLLKNGLMLIKICH